VQESGIAQHDIEPRTNWIVERGRRKHLLRRTDDERQRCSQLVTDVREEVRLELVEFFRLVVKAIQLGVGIAQLFIRSRKLLRPNVNLRLHLVDPIAQFLSQLPLRGSMPLDLHELGNVVDAVEDVHELSATVEDRCVMRAPKALFEATALRVRTTDVVLLHGHRIGYPSSQDALNRRARVVDRGRFGFIGVVGKNIEHTAADDLVALRERRLQIRVAGGCHDELWSEDHIEPGHSKSMRKSNGGSGAGDPIASADVARAGRRILARRLG
jgi:hypothetical protein